MFDERRLQLLGAKQRHRGREMQRSHRLPQRTERSRQLARRSRSCLEATLARLKVLLIGLVGVAGLFLFTPEALAQTFITLRFIDAESGKPLQGISTSVSTWNSDEPLVPADKIVSRSSFQTTNKQGEVIFSAPEPAPKYLAVNHFTIELRGCSAGVFSLAEVLRSGVVADYNPRKRRWCGNLSARTSARPGEIVIFDIRMTFWDRLRQEMP